MLGCPPGTACEDPGMSRARRRFARRGVLILFAAVLLSLSPWIVAQARALCVLSVTLEVPVLGRTAELLTPEPRVEDGLVAGVPTLTVRPAGAGPWPVIVFGNGATREGRRHPVVQRLAGGLARAGFMVLVPDLPDLRAAAAAPEAAPAMVAVAEAARRLPEARGGRVGFLGVSTGGALGLVAAKDPGLAPHVSVAAAIAPYTDIRNVLRLGTTGSYRAGGEVRRFASDPYLSLVTARSLVRALPPGGDRDALLAVLEPLDDEEHDPIRRLLAGRPDHVGRQAEQVLTLLANRAPERFDPLYAALPPRVRSGMELLSPVTVPGTILAPVELAAGPRDKYFPTAELEAPGLGARSRVTLTSALDHADPRPRLSELADLLRLDGYAVRILRYAASAG